MGRRRSPYLTKTKGSRHRENQYTSPGTHYTSRERDDNFYTTESNDTRTAYDYTNKYKKYKTYMDYFTTSNGYDSRLFETISPKRKVSGSSYTFDDYATSGQYYDKNLEDQMFSENYNDVSSFRGYDHSYPKGSKSRDKKRLRLSQDSDRAYYPDEILDESDQYVDRSKRYRSPRSRYYQDLIHEEPEKEFHYEKYFESTNPKVKSSPKQRRHSKDVEERYEKQNKLQSRIPNKRNDYQVYAYQGPKHHEEVFKGKTHPGDLSLSSEVEITTHEYPLLAFRDEKSKNKETDMVYLPIMVIDKKTGKSRSEKNPEEPHNQYNKEQFQVYAAKLQEQNNIFQHFGDFPDTITSKEEASTEKAPSPHIEAKSGMRNADSLLNTTIDDADYTDFRDETNEGIPFTTDKNPFTYQVDVDISPNKPTGSLKDKQHSRVKNNSINDPLHDGYPVTKDYIKVSASDQKKRQSTLSLLISREENKTGSAMAPKITEEIKSNTVKEEDQSVKLIDDQTISKSIAQSKANPGTKSIMRTLSQEQSTTRQSVAGGTKQNSRASHIGQAMRANTKDRPTASILTVVNEEVLQDFHHRQSVSGNNKEGSEFAENSAHTEQIHRGDRKSMKPDMYKAQSTDKQNKIHTTPWVYPSPLSGHQQSVLHSQPDKERRSTVAHMVGTATPSLQNLKTSHAQSRKSTLAPKPSAANLPGDDSRKLMESSGSGRPPEAVHPSQGKNSLVQSSAHHNIHVVAEKTGKLSHKSDGLDDSKEALRQFTKDIFQVDLASQGKTPSLKSEQKKPSVLQGKGVDTAMRTSHGADNKHQTRQSAAGQNVLGNVESPHERIGDTSAGTDKTPTVDEGKIKTGHSFRTTSKILQTLSKLGKKKTSEHAEPYIPTGSPTGSKKSDGKAKPATQDDDSDFVRSIEPTVTQYKKDQNKTNTLMKSNSKSDTTAPQEKKSLTRMFSRSKSNLNNESGDDNKKMKKNKSKSKSKSMLGILKRSKSSEVLVTPPADDKQPIECECLAHYIQNTRTCAYFFLGTTLHEQIMNIIKTFLGGN